MAQKSQEESFVVQLARPALVTIGMLREYVQDAVKGWRGGLDPGDPLFGIDRATVTVKRPRKKSYLASFTGHVHEGYAVIHARSPAQASKLLEKELSRIGLSQEVSAEDMQQIDVQSNVIIVTNGDT